MKEFQRLKEQEQKSLDWNVKRSLTKINYRIHTDAVKEHLIPENLSAKYQMDWERINFHFFKKELNPKFARFSFFGQ